MKKHNEKKEETFVSNHEMDYLYATYLRAECVRERLTRDIIGQDYAADRLKSAILAAYATKPYPQKGPRALIFAFGLPGVGKSESAIIAAQELGLPCYCIDCTRYTEREGHNPDGINKSYKEAAEGEITGPVKKMPAGILILNEFDLSHANVKNRFQPLFETGFLHDQYHDEEIDFRNVIIIITSNAGSALYESLYRYNYATLPQSTILNALTKDVNPDTDTHRFTPAMVSRLARGTLIPFNKLSGRDLCAIAQLKAKKLCEDWKENRYPYLALDYDGDLFARSLLFSKGGQADARNISAAAEATLSEHLENAAALLCERGEDGLRRLKNIRLSFDYGKDEKITQYFHGEERYRVAVYCAEEERERVESCPRLDVCYVKEGTRISSLDYDATLISVDETKCKKGLQMIREAQRDEEVPIYAFSLTQKKTRVERKLYNKEGVSGFYNAEEDGDFSAWLNGIAETIELSKAVTQLARESCVINHDTVYAVEEEGNGLTVTATACNYRKEKAVDASDERELCAAHEIPDVKFSDVKGARETVEEVKELIEIFKNPIEYKRKGYDIPRGILFYGEPGVGKTLIAKAIANESGSVFIQKNATEFESKWVGESSEIVRKVFQLARKYGAILFIDEIDTFGKPRGRGIGGSAESSDRIQNAFLSEMDGFRQDDKRPAFVIAATNFPPEKLDKAFLRRFDRIVEIKLPKADDRFEILLHYMDKYGVKISDGDIRTLVERTAGKSPADLAKLVKQTKRNCKEKVPTLKDFEEAFELLTYGEKRTWSDEAIRKTTYHECGHCLAHYLTGEIPSYVTNISRGSHGGYMQFTNDEEKFDYTYQELLDRICVCFGGRAAERLAYGEKGLTTGASADLAQARAWAKRIVDDYGMQEGFLLGAGEACSEESRQRFDRAVNGILTEQYDRAVKMMEEHRPLLEGLVERLLKANSMNKQELESFFREVDPSDGGRI